MTNITELCLQILLTEETSVNFTDSNFFSSEWNVTFFAQIHRSLLWSSNIGIWAQVFIVSFSLE